jgi:hypothetical protein
MNELEKEISWKAIYLRDSFRPYACEFHQVSVY